MGNKQSRKKLNKYNEAKPIIIPTTSPYQLLVHGFINKCRISNEYIIPSVIFKLCYDFYGQYRSSLFLNLYPSYSYREDIRLIMTTINDNGLFFNIEIKKPSNNKNQKLPRSLCYISNFNISDNSFTQQCIKHNIKHPSALLSNGCIIFDTINHKNLSQGIENMTECNAFEYELPFEHQKNDTIIYSELHESIFGYSPSLQNTQKCFKVCIKDNTWIYQDFVDEESPFPVQLQYSPKLPIAMNMIDNGYKIWISGTIKKGGTLRGQFPIYGGYIYDLNTKKWINTQRNHWSFYSKDLYYNPLKQCMYGLVATSWNYSRPGDVTLYNRANLGKYDMNMDKWYCVVNGAKDISLYGSKCAVWGHDNHKDIIFVGFCDGMLEYNNRKNRMKVLLFDERDGDGPKKLTTMMEKNMAFLNESVNLMQLANIYFSP